MIIANIEISSYNLPLKSSRRIGKISFNSRKGFLIRIINAEGQCGYGEVSPLPGVSRETLAMTKRQLIWLKRKLLFCQIPGGLENLSGQFNAWLKPYRLFSSVQCGIEMAVLSLLSSSKKIPLAKLFNPRVKRKAVLSGLLDGNERQILSEAKKMLNSGRRCFKLKVGRASHKTDIKKINALRKLKPNLTLRLDANRAWTFREAIDFGKNVGIDKIEYLEEPLKNPRQISAFYNSIRIPVALDESLPVFLSTKLAFPKGAKTLVIKPMIVGGFEKALKIIRMAKQKNLKAVISSSFETPFGLEVLLQFASAFTPHSSAGLDTDKYFK